MMWKADISVWPEKPNVIQAFSDDGQEQDFVPESTCRIKNTTDICNRDFYTTAKCSRCKASYTIDFKYLKYCPNCGARVVS